MGAISNTRGGDQALTATSFQLLWSSSWSLSTLSSPSPTYIIIILLVSIIFTINSNRHKLHLFQFIIKLLPISLLSCAWNLSFLKKQNNIFKPLNTCNIPNCCDVPPNDVKWRLSRRMDDGGNDVRVTFPPLKETMPWSSSAFLVMLAGSRALEVYGRLI